jgi:two-component system phosphate regulon response regulator OmpR
MNMAESTEHPQNLLPAEITHETPHILVVDDDDRLRALLSQYLTDQGFLVSIAASASQAEDMLGLFHFDAMVLDVMMPGETGFEFMMRHGEHIPRMPVLMLTALGESDDRIKGLETGVADYMAKPFAPKELLLRLKNLLKRASIANLEDHTGYFCFGDYRFNIGNKQLLLQQTPVYLTSSEQDCLAHFVTHAGQALSREKLAGLLGDVSNTRSIDVLINRLRKKIEPNPSRPVYLQTIRNAGYQLHGKMDGKPA